MLTSSTSKADQGQEESAMQMFLKSSKTPVFADCVIVSNSGDRYYTYKGMLCQKSIVFRDMFENFEDPASSPAAGEGAFELQLPDASQAIAATVAHIHDSRGFWKTIKRSSLDEFLEVLENLVSFAHKYDITGICGRVDEVLSRTANLDNLISSGLLFKLWELVDYYHLERSHKSLQARLSRDPALFIVSFDAGILPFCDYLRSALTVGQSYASALREGQTCCSEMTKLLRETKAVLRKCVETCDDVDSTLRDCDSAERTRMPPELKKIESMKFRLQNLADQITY